MLKMQIKSIIDPLKLGLLREILKGEEERKILSERYVKGRSSTRALIPDTYNICSVASRRNFGTMFLAGSLVYFP